MIRSRAVGIQWAWNSFQEGNEKCVWEMKRRQSVTGRTTNEGDVPNKSLCLLGSFQNIIRKIIEKAVLETVLLTRFS